MERLQLLQQKFYSLKTEIKQLATFFSSLLITLQGISINNCIIANQIEFVNEKLKRSLNATTEFDRELKTFQQEIIALAAECGRRYRAEMEEIRNIENQIHLIQTEYAEAVEKQKELINERTENEELLNNLKARNKELDGSQTIASAIGNGSNIARIVYTIYLNTTVANHIKNIGTIKSVNHISDVLKVSLNYLKTPEGKLDILIKNIELINKKVDELNDKRQNLSSKYEIKQQKWIATDKLLREMKEHINILQAMLINNNSWSEILTKWQNFLNGLQPLAQRVINAQSYPFPEILNEAIEEFRLRILNYDVYEIHDQAVKLSLISTS